MAETPRTPPARTARQVHRPADLVRRVVMEACNEGDLGVLDELAPCADMAGGAVRLREALPAFRAAVPDARWEIVEQIAAGNTVVTLLAVHGTFAGGLIGLAPPGRPATLSGVAVSRFARGRLVEVWVQADLLGLLQQLGVMPPLNLTQAVTVARVLHAGTLLTHERPPIAARTARRFDPAE